MIKDYQVYVKTGVQTIHLKIVLSEKPAPKGYTLAFSMRASSRQTAVQKVIDAIKYGGIYKIRVFRDRKETWQ